MIIVGENCLLGLIGTLAPFVIAATRRADVMNAVLAQRR